MTSGMTAGRGGTWSGRTGETRDRVVGVTPFGWPAALLAVAVERAGGLGVLDLGRDHDRALAALADVCRWWQGSFGVRIAAGCEVRPHELPDAVDTVLIDAPVLEGGPLRDEGIE